MKDDIETQETQEMQESKETQENIEKVSKRESKKFEKLSSQGYSYNSQKLRGMYGFRTHRKLKLFILLLLLIAIGGVFAWSYQNENENESAQPQTTEQSAQQEQEVAADEVPDEIVYTSKLYPDFSFTVPTGWTVNEPETYDETDWGPGSANGAIVVTNGDTVLTLSMVSVMATGFEGYSCYNADALMPAGDYHRYTDSEGNTVFTDGITDTSEDWESTLADTEFTTLVDPDPNLCISFPYLGTYSSTLNQADYDLPYGFTNNEKVMVWLSASVDGVPSDELLAEVDSIITSKSDSAEIL